MGFCKGATSVFFDRPLLCENQHFRGHLKHASTSPHKFEAQKTFQRVLTDLPDMGRKIGLLNEECHTRSPWPRREATSEVTS